ncbi:hypothetical protein Tco_0546700 [Tanacetum coccineum]
MRESMRKVLDLQTAKDAQAKEIAALKKRIQMLERRKMSRPTGLKRPRKIGMIRRVESFEDQESLGVTPPKMCRSGRNSLLRSQTKRKLEQLDQEVAVYLTVISY